MVTLLGLTSCSNVTFHTNLDGNYIAREVASNDLYQFPTGQAANESGASLLGAVNGLSCLPYRRDGYKKYEVSQLKGLAIEDLKLEVLRIGANAYIVEQCRTYSDGSNQCSKGIQCIGQAYDY